MSEETEGEPDYSETFTQDPGDDDDEVVPRPLRPEWAIVAHAWADPTSPTYQKKQESYWTAYPIPLELQQEPKKRETARRAFYKLLEKQAFRDEIERIRLQIRGSAGFTKEDYFQLLLKREELFATRGGKGDAQAAAATLKLIGQTAGLLIQKVEDVTPPERKRPMTGEQLVDSLLEAAERMRRLRDPVARPALPAAEELPVTIVDKPAENR